MGTQNSKYREHCGVERFSVLLFLSVARGWISKKMQTSFRQRENESHDSFNPQPVEVTGTPFTYPRVTVSTSYSTRTYVVSTSKSTGEIDVSMQVTLSTEESLTGGKF